MDHQTSNTKLLIYFRRLITAALHQPVIDMVIDDQLTTPLVLSYTLAGEFTGIDIQATELMNDLASFHAINNLIENISNIQIIIYRTSI